MAPVAMMTAMTALPSRLERTDVARDRSALATLVNR
jgi:hypothetical protein